MREISNLEMKEQVVDLMMEINNLEIVDQVVDLMMVEMKNLIIPLMFVEMESVNLENLIVMMTVVEEATMMAETTQMMVDKKEIIVEMDIVKNTKKAGVKKIVVVNKVENLMVNVVMDFVIKMKKNQDNVMMTVIQIKEDHEEKLEHKLEDQVMHQMYSLKIY